MNKRTLTITLITAVMVSLAAAFILETARGGQASKKADASAGATIATLPMAGSSRTDKEIARCEALAKSRPDDVNVWADLGDVLMQKARETADVSYYGHAERCYRRALAINAHSVPGLLGMSWVNSGRHEFEKSIEYANQVLKLDPDNSLAFGLLGDAAVEMGDYNSAYERYQKMLNLKPDASAYSRGAHLLFVTGDTRKAVWLMSKAISSGSSYAENNAWCRAQLAQILFSS